MAGIERIRITDKVQGRGAYRFPWSRKRQPEANRVYREIFRSIGSPLLPGTKEILCTKDEFEAGYDHALGIDVLLRFEGGFTATMQEKFLSFDKATTITVEYMQNPLTGEQGDWFNLKCQYYFVGYDTDESLTFNDWILVDWPVLMRSTQQGLVRWYGNHNKRDGARASFKYAYFDAIPSSCVVARYAPFVAKPRQLAISKLLGIDA